MKRRLMPDAVRERIAANLAEARLRRSEPQRGDLWRPLEEAHILSQPWALTHVRVHAAMLLEALRQRDRREIVGQIARMAVTGPGSRTGRYPVGNTGRATVSAFAPMPVPPDLSALLDE